MNGCRLVIEKKGDEVLIQARDTGIAEVAEMCGVLLQALGVAAFRGGMPLDDIKNHLYDVYDAAMDAMVDQVLGEQIRGGTPEPDGN